MRFAPFEHKKSPGPARPPPFDTVHHDPRHTCVTNSGFFSRNRCRRIEADPCQTERRRWPRQTGTSRNDIAPGDIISLTKSLGRPLKKAVGFFVF